MVHLPSFADKQPHYYNCTYKPWNRQAQIHIAEHAFRNDRQQYHSNNCCKSAHNSVKQRIDYRNRRTQVCRSRFGKHNSADGIACAPVTAHKSADSKPRQIRSPLEHTAKDKQQITRQRRTRHCDYSYLRPNLSDTKPEINVNSALPTGYRNKARVISSSVISADFAMTVLYVAVPNEAR